MESLGLNQIKTIMERLINDKNMKNQYKWIVTKGEQYQATVGFGFSIRLRPKTLQNVKINDMVQDTL